MKFKLALTFLLLFLLSSARVASAVAVLEEKTIVQPNVIVSATIGIPKMTLWGYSSPVSEIELSGVGVNQKITSREDGYYSFDLVYLPNTSSFPELCVTSIDEKGRATPPTCIPEIMAGNYFYNVGPVILPPTISLSAGEINPGTQVSAEGRTIPGANIKVVLSRPDFKKGLFGFQLVKSALAYYLPSYSIISNDNGDFSFNMPSESGATWRVFTIAEYEKGSMSPKSNTLKLISLTPTTYVLKNFWAFLSTFLTWPRILILEFLIIVLLAIVILVLAKKRKKNVEYGKPEKPKESIQNQSNIIEKYQEFLNNKSG